MQKKQAMNEWNAILIPAHIRSRYPRPSIENVPFKRSITSQKEAVHTKIAAVEICFGIILTAHVPNTAEMETDLTQTLQSLFFDLL